MRLNHFWINFFLQEKSTCKNSQKSFFQFPLPYAYIKFSWKIISVFILKASYSANCVRRNFHVPDFHIFLYQSKVKIFWVFICENRFSYFSVYFSICFQAKPWNIKLTFKWKWISTKEFGCGTEWKNQWKIEILGFFWFSN